MNRNYAVTELSPERALANLAEFTTPTSSPRTPTSAYSQTRLLSVYPLYARCTDDLAALTPIHHRNLRYHYCLLVAMAALPAHSQVVKFLHDNLFSIWPKMPDFKDTDNYVFTSESTRSALCDAQGNLVVLMRAVIDPDGQLILAINGSGCDTVPFHNQMSFAPVYGVTNNIVFDEAIKGANRRLIFAGEIGFGADGLIYYVSNRSGHFKPSEDCFVALWDYLSLRPERLAPTLHCRNFQAEAAGSESRFTMSREQIQQRALALSAEQRELFSETNERVVTVKSEVRARPEPARNPQLGQRSRAWLSIYAPEGDEPEDRPVIKQLCLEPR